MTVQRGRGDGGGGAFLSDTVALEQLLEVAGQLIDGGGAGRPAEAAVEPIILEGAPEEEEPAAAPPLSGRITVVGAVGPEQVCISQTDTPKMIEQCIRALFGVGQGAAVVLRDVHGCAVPLGPGLLVSESKPPRYDLEMRPDFAGRVSKVRNNEILPAHPDLSPTSISRDDSSPPVEQGDTPAKLAAAQHILSQRLNQAFPDDVSEDSVSTSCTLPQLPLLPHVIPNATPDHKYVPPFSTSGANAAAFFRASKLSKPTQTTNWMSAAILEEEIGFWCKLVSRHDMEVDYTLDSAESLEAMANTYKLDAKLRSSPFDTSPQRIDMLYDMWLCEDDVLEKQELQMGLARDCGIQLTRDQLDRALSRVVGRFKDGERLLDDRVPKIVFASLFQRLVLGVLCSSYTSSAERQIRVIEYSDVTDPVEQEVTEHHFLFGGHTRDRDHGHTMDTPQSVGRRSQTTRWAFVETSRSELLLKLGAKFFLHPLATEDMIKASIEGTTKIDRYRHQYFVSLEVYAIDAAQADADREMGRTTSEDDKEPEVSVASRISRSTISMIATGNPPTRSKAPSSRDWLITVVSDGEQRVAANLDFFDRFASDEHAAHKVLLAIRDDVLMHKRQREHQADFLLWSVIDRAAGELKPIFNAYGRRLRWMQDQLDLNRHSIPQSYIDEVGRLHPELQELRTWVGCIKSLVKFLENDCRQDPHHAGELQLPFGRDPRDPSGGSQGKIMRTFLRRTQDQLDEALEGLAVLDDLARKFTNDTERYKGDFMNQALLVITVFSAVFLPAQFMTGVYGMNFKRIDDGTPSIPELRMGVNGYKYFWGLVASILLTGYTSVYCFFNWRRCRKACCKRQQRHNRKSASGLVRQLSPHCADEGEF